MKTGLTKRQLISATVLSAFLLDRPWIEEGRKRVVHWQTWPLDEPRPESEWSSGSCSMERFRTKMVGHLVETYGECFVSRVTLA